MYVMMKKYGRCCGVQGQEKEDTFKSRDTTALIAS
jgi:hypothetical protein